MSKLMVKLACHPKYPLEIDLACFARASYKQESRVTAGAHTHGPQAYGHPYSSPDSSGSSPLHASLNSTYSSHTAANVFPPFLAFLHMRLLAYMYISSRCLLLPRRVLLSPRMCFQPLKTPSFALLATPACYVMLRLTSSFVAFLEESVVTAHLQCCLLYTSPSPRD